jgi:hypothetical protein
MNLAPVFVLFVNFVPSCEPNSTETPASAGVMARR